MKKCNVCNKELPTSRFSRNKTTKDKLSYTCKTCSTEVRNSYSDKLNTPSKEEARKYIDNLAESGQMFLCKTCNISYTADNFYYKRDYGKVVVNHSRCKSCAIEYQMKKSFGIGFYEYNEILKSQNHKCQICEIHIDDYQKQGYRNRFAIDHNHHTGRIRGLLCDHCNRGIGLLRENIKTLHNAIKYLEKDKDMV